MNPSPQSLPLLKLTGGLENRLVEALLPHTAEGTSRLPNGRRLRLTLKRMLMLKRLEAQLLLM